ncbi:MAG: hypothetical protein MUP90_13175 [Gammaproteobacteria bacterium]|nr:hypothetical protein [Gammaproteobacteria bacterium]
MGQLRDSSASDLYSYFAACTLKRERSDLRIDTLRDKSPLPNEKPA